MVHEPVVASRDLQSLDRLRRKLGTQFLAGVVLYTGVRAYTQDSVHILPIDRLWTPTA